VGEQLILETTFLVDLERESRRQETGPAHRLLEERLDDRFHITFTVLGELAAGRSLTSRKRWARWIAPYPVLWCDPDVCWQYGEAFRYLQRTGALIGANDLWIAATAIANEMGVVTRNTAHFERVPGLRVIDSAGS
jgi:tRNA(fMet)-specific endonuclease VapC